MDGQRSTSGRNLSLRNSHRSNPLAPTSEDGEYGPVAGDDTYNVDAVVHSLIAGMEEGDHGLHGTDGSDGENEDDLDEQDFNETETLFTRINDAPGMGGAGAVGGVGAATSASGGADGGVLADHEDEMLAHVTSNRDFTDKERFGCCGRIAHKRFCGITLSGTCISITMVVGLIIFVASVMISYANKNASGDITYTGDFHLQHPHGLDQSVPPPPPDLDVVCSKHFYSELGHGFDACKKACAKGSCCYEQDMGRNCFKYNLEYCAAYTVCLILNEAATMNITSDGDDVDGMTTTTDFDVSDEDEDADDETYLDTTTTSDNQKKVMPPPDDLADLCEDTASSPACEMACEESKCCFELDMSLNCYSYSDNYATCDNYRQSCSILGYEYGGTGDGSTVITEDETTTTVESDLPFGMASEMLNDMCQETYIATAMRGECERLCLPASCCWMDEDSTLEAIESCVDGNEDICESYAMCDNLNLVPPRPLLEMNLVCDITNNPAENCQEACAKANCCVTPDSERNCFNHYAHVCSLYQPCVSVDSSFDQVHILPDAPSNLAALCDVTTDEHSFDTCRKTCHAAQCCWMDDTDDCADDTIDKCTGYEPCDILNRSPPDAPLELSDWCTGSTTEQQEACVDACDAANCCIAPPDSEERCFYHEDVCDDYIVCSSIDPAFGAMGIDDDDEDEYDDDEDDEDLPLSLGSDELPAPPSTLATDCNALNNDPTAVMNCQTSCEQAECCISDDTNENCFEDNEVLCLEYFSCFTYNDKFASMIEQPYIAPAKVTDVTTLVKKCHNSARYPNAKSYCEEICRGGACCVADTESSVNCFEPFTDDCMVYAGPCAVVYPEFGTLVDEDYYDDEDEDEDEDDEEEDDGDTTTLEKPSSTLARKCNFLFFDKDPEGRSLCEEECTKAYCCIDEEFNCFEDNEVTCLEYFPCFSINERFADMIEQPYVAPMKLADPTSLMEDCGNADVDDAASLDCQEICGGAECCVQNVVKANCYDAFQEDCNAYASCSSVFDEFVIIAESVDVSSTVLEDEDTTDLPVPVSNLDDICAPESIEDEETREECEEACSAAECCFLEEDDADYCGDTNAIQCVNYSVCGILKNGFGLVPAPLFILEVCGTINSEVAIPPSDVSACEAICKPASDCCIDDDPARNCFADNEAICIEYSPCVAIDTKYSVMQDGSTNEETPIGSEPEEPKLDVNDVCSRVPGGSEEDKEYCQAICSPGSDCCVDESPDTNCFVTHSTTCLKYVPCVAIDDRYATMITQLGASTPIPDEEEAETTYDGHEPPSDLSTTCNELRIQSSQELLDACEDACDEAMCCVDNMDGTDGVIGSGEEGSCFAQYKDSCLSYATSCASVDSSFAELLNEYGDDGVLPYVPPVRPPSTLYALCNSASNSDTQEECMKLCDSAVCCVSENPITNCFDGFGDICMAYMACQSVYEEFTNLGNSALSAFLENEEDDMDGDFPPNTATALPEPSGQLGAVCSEIAMEVSDTACNILCKPSECCFASYRGPTPCADDVQCPNYSVCEIVFDGGL